MAITISTHLRNIIDTLTNPCTYLWCLCYSIWVLAFCLITFQVGQTRKDGQTITAHFAWNTFYTQKVDSSIPEGTIVRFFGVMVYQNYDNIYDYVEANALLKGMPRLSDKTVRELLEAQ